MRTAAVDSQCNCSVRRVIILQARMGSSRLPGKVLKGLGGHTLLSHELKRLKLCRCADEIVLATTNNRDDDSLISLAEQEGVRWFRGSEHDVLSRFVGAAAEARADIVVRVTGDCPLIDAEQVDRVIAELEHNESSCDYAANILRRTFPRGLDTEAIFRDALHRIDRLGKSAAAREHVTYFVHCEHPELFLCRSVEDSEDNSDLRWTVDTQEDFDMVSGLHAALGLGDAVWSYRDLVRYIRLNPQIARVNQHITQKPV